MEQNGYKGINKEFESLQLFFFSFGPKHKGAKHSG